jgi:putative ABC transport system permease protein
VFQDLRYALRGLRRSPGFTAAAVLSLALGIGFNAAVYSVIRADVAPDPSVCDPGTVVHLESADPKGSRDEEISLAEFLTYRDRAASFESLAALRFTRYSLTPPGGVPQYVVSEHVTLNYFPMLGIRPLIGRVFETGEDQPGRDRVIVIPYAFWQTHFSSDRGVIGKQVLLSGEPVTVIGILPETWHGGSRRIYLPLRLDAAGRNARNLAVIGRLRTGVRRETAQAETASIAHRLEIERPETNRGWTMHVMADDHRLAQWLKRNESTRLLATLFGAVAFVLLIACVNVAGLLLARGAVRRKEIATRRALGASRARIVRQWLTESLVLGLLAAGPALLLALDSRDFVARMWDIRITSGGDAAMAGAVALATLASVLLFGVIPAWQASASDEIAMHTGRTAHPRALRLRNVLIVGEITLALLLLSGAGLAIRSFSALSGLSPGFDTRHLVAIRYHFVDRKYADDDRKAAFFRQAAERALALPGVRGAAWVWGAPVVNAIDRFRIRFDGAPPFAGRDDWPRVGYRRVSADFFRVLGLPLLAGRDFTASDTAKVIINEPMARRYFAGRNPIGQRLAMDQKPEHWSEVIGVVPPMITDDLRSVAAPVPEVIEVAAVPSEGPWLLVRTAADPETLVEPLRRAVASVDPDTPVANVQLLDRALLENIQPQRSLAGLLGVFAAMALILAMIGVYGVMSYFVTQRTHEVGVRIALGAQSRDILRLVLGRSGWLTAAGVTLGLVLSVATERVIGGLFFGVSPTDPATLLGAAVVLAAVALLAGAVPARRATRVDPIRALRTE